MKLNVILVVAGLAVAVNAQAQSSVTLFGLIDAGVSYVSNEGGKGSLKFDDGIYTPNFFGIRGTEDIGGGTSVIFKLVDQFDVGTGSIISGQTFFGQEAYVGLQNDRFGSIRLGEQYDFMSEALLFTGTDGTLYGGGFYNFRNGPFDNLQIPNNPTGAMSWDRLNGVPIDNSVKYTSPVFGGFTFGAMYGFGNVAGSISNNNAYSFGLTYRSSSLSGGAAYTSQRYTGIETGGPQVRIANWGVGLRYSFSTLAVNGLVTTVKNEFTGAAAYVGQIGLTWQPSPFWSFTTDYMYMKGNEQLNNNHAHQLTAALTYQLSKRTGVYAEAVYQRANSGAQAQINGVFVPSGSPSQAIGRVGIKTMF
ncbi:porin [Paraburkholderia gardini]|uniref:Outer membrane porin protein 32 n=1 Tax=Paraburkholderia gardini TaxID=2823469 RepID=A0ABM8U7X3_9BURK|nr:porin [Paraburkholderia gardini]CAG4913704.1 Outer membrane porin protein 32 [Paraburkholderia gardini]